MKILAIEQDVAGVASEAYEPHLKAEAAHVWALIQQGVIREIYFQQDRSNAVLILECTDVKQARTVLDTLPLVEQGLIAFDVIPLKPYPGFARLFADQTENDQRRKP